MQTAAPPPSDFYRPPYVPLDEEQKPLSGGNMSHYHFQQQQQEPSQPAVPPQTQPEDHKIYIIDTAEFLSKNESHRGFRTFMEMTNLFYRACYKFCFMFFMGLVFFGVPFIGMAAGFTDAVLVFFIRPFLRPVGSAIADLFGYSRQRGRLD